MRRLAVLAVVLGACSPSLQTGVFLEGDFAVPDELVSSALPADTMRYLVRLPPDFESGDDVPLVVFLHGSGDDDYDSRWLTSYGLPAVVEFEDVPTDSPFVLLAPQATPGSSWDIGHQPATVLALVDHVVNRFGLDPDSVSLTGVSMGGYGVWHLATQFPDRFQAAASLSGSGYGTTTLPDDLDVCSLSAVDLRVYHGARDLVSLPELNLEVISEWQQRCGAEIDVRMIEDAGHFETVEQVYRDPAFYDWFLGG